jgi:hypothetical protein
LRAQQQWQETISGKLKKMTESYDGYKIPLQGGWRDGKVDEPVNARQRCVRLLWGNWYERSIKSGRLDISLWRVGRACSDDWAAPSERRYGNSHAGNLLLRAESVAYTTGGRDAPHSVWIPFYPATPAGVQVWSASCVASVLDGAIDRRVNTDGN